MGQKGTEPNLFHLRETTYRVGWMSQNPTLVPEQEPLFKGQTHSARSRRLILCRAAFHNIRLLVCLSRSFCHSLVTFILQCNVGEFRALSSVFHA